MIHIVKRNHVLLFDMDGVLIDSSSESVTFLNGYLGTTYTIHDKNHYSWTWGVIKEALGKHMSDEEIVDFAYGEHILRQAKPVPGAVKLIKDLSDAGFDVRISTYRPVRQNKVTVESVEEYFPSIKHVYMREEEYSGEDTFKCKLMALEDAKPICFIDDHGELILNLFPLVTPSVALGIMDWSWNRNLPKIVGRYDSPALRRIGNFEHIDVSPSPWVRDYKRWLNELLKTE